MKPEASKCMLFTFRLRKPPFTEAGVNILTVYVEKKRHLLLAILLIDINDSSKKNLVTTRVELATLAYQG